MEQVKKTLGEAIGLKKEIAALENERSALRSMAERATRSCYGQRRPGRSQSRVEIGALDLVHLEERLDQKQKDYTLRYDEISQEISNLEDPTARTILRLRYLYGAPWKEICNKVCYSCAGAHYKHNRALLELKDLLDQVPRS